MKNIHILGLVALVLVAVGVFIVTDRTTGVVEGASTSSPIQIGAAICLTSVCAEWGENELRGIQLAIKDINAKGGVLGRPLELTTQDSAEGEVKNAINAYQALRQQGVQFIVGPTWTPAALALAPMVSKDDVIMVSASVGVADFNEAGGNLFNMWPHDELATRFLARQVYAGGARKVAIFSSQQPWEQTQGNAFEDEFKKLGGSVVYKVEPPADVRDLRTEAVQIKDSKPDVVMFSNLTNMGIAAKELKNLGYAGKKVSVLMDDTRVEAAQGGLNGTIYVQSPKSQQWFSDSFTQKYAVNPGISADTAYDAVQFLAKGITDAGTTDLEQVQKVMNSYKDFKGGAAGDVVFDGKRGVIKDPVLWIVQGTKFIEYSK